MCVDREGQDGGSLRFPIVHNGSGDPHPAELYRDTGLFVRIEFAGRLGPTIGRRMFDRIFIEHRRCGFHGIVSCHRHSARGDHRSHEFTLSCPSHLHFIGLQHLNHDFFTVNLHGIRMRRHTPGH